MDGLIIDSFAGGGGASEGIRLALNNHPDIAINHDPMALAIHEVNHPDTEHYCQNIQHLHPLDVTKGRPVRLLWASPDCTHHSRAKGGKPRVQGIRDLPWAVVFWAQKVRPDVIILENVPEFVGWGPLDKEGQPIKERKGEDFRRFVNALRRKGYSVQWRELTACDYGAPTSRTRLFMIARCDGEPIVWPTPTHGSGPGLKPYRTAAECIDWSIPCQSIFDRQKPLAENTCRRIARGIVKFVLENPEPFIVHLNHTADYYQYFRGQRIDRPLNTITKSPGMALVAPSLLHNTTHHSPGSPENPLPTITTGNHHYLIASHLSRQFGQGVGADVLEPVPTVTAGGMGKSALVAAFMAQHNGGRTGREITAPLSTITHRGTQQQFVAASVTKFKGRSDGQLADEPLHTVQTKAQYGAVAAFLTKYYGTNIGQGPGEPIQTITSKHRFGLVTVNILGEPFVIVDIGMRMLQPRELFRAQGFSDDYIIDPVFGGKQLTKTAQVKACGNSVCPPVAEAVVRANLPNAGAMAMEA